MSKKQTTNTFGKGMMLDLHPLTVPSDVLTDALNATTITMNGNEGILQNDMGNGRVESAFLPPGYVPVGIKEYGGIIYVASYNPVTNKSQIGSFPSPERNIDQTEDGQLNTPLELLNDTYTRTYKCSTFNTTYDGLNLQIGLGQLSNKVEIFGDYKTIRSGDKFGFYFDDSGQTNDVNSLSNYFSFNNAEEDKRKQNIFFSESENKPPFSEVGGWDEENNVYQNNIITLSTQVLDSNNNLRDLTPQLKRYDNENNPMKFTTESAEDKFNSGYFISSNKNSDWDPVNQERNKSALNTYNNKLFGKLYLVGKVNVIDHIDVQLVTKSYIDESLAEYNRKLTIGNSESNVLYFYIDYYYNCPVSKLHPPKLYCTYNGNITENKSGYIRLAESIEYSYNEINVVSSGERYDSYIEFCENLNCNNYHKGDKIYNDYENESIPKFSNITEPIQYDIPDSEDPEQTITVQQNTTNIKSWNPENPTYDPLTNLYRQRYFAYVILDNTYSLENVNSTILNYLIIPRMTGLPGEGNNSKLLTHIAVEGSIDLSKIGSGKCDITTWRYICTDNMVKLNWGLEDYPLDTDVIEDMRMDFYDWNNRTDLITDQDESIQTHSNLNWYLMFNQISYNSVNTSITFGDDTLKKRHIYLVKLSRKKNGNYESIGWRILITTPIYNDLFMTYDDYCPDIDNSEPDINNSEIVKAIQERNRIDLKFNISLEQNTKSHTTYTTELKQSDNIKEGLINNDTPALFYYLKEAPENKEGYIIASLSIGNKHYYTYYKQVNNTIEVLDIITPDVDNYVEYTDFDDIKTEQDKHTYSYNIYSLFNTTKTVNVDIDISDKYPFQIKDKNQVGYTINPNSEIIKNILVSLINTNYLDIIENNNEECITSDSRICRGVGNITIKNQYKIPSQAVFNYNQSKERKNTKYTYNSLRRFITNSLSNEIIFPIIGGNRQSEGTAYFELLTYNFEKKDIVRQLRDSIGYYTKDKLSSRKKFVNLSLYKDRINEFLNNAGLEDNTFIIVGSPITFGWDGWTSDQDNKAKGMRDVFLSILDIINTQSQNINTEGNYSEGNPNYYVLYNTSSQNDVSGSFMIRRHVQDIYINQSTKKRLKLGGDPNTDEKWIEGTNELPGEGSGGFINTFGNEKSTWGYKDWFVLLWKNKEGRFVAVDKFYTFDEEWKEIKNHNYNFLNTDSNDPGVNNLTQNTYYSGTLASVPQLKANDNANYGTVIGDQSDMKDWVVNKIFGRYADNILFRTNVGDTVEAYFIDVNDIKYNTDYTVDIQDSINISNIYFDEGLLEYIDSSKEVNQYGEIQHIDNDNIIAIGKKRRLINNTYVYEFFNDNDDLNAKFNKYLKFELSSKPQNKTFSTDTYTILGMDEFINSINKSEIEGCIKVYGKVYSKDSSGLELTEPIYVFENNKILSSNNASENKEFINSLTVQNDKLLISNYSQDKSEYYALSFGERPPGDQVGMKLVIKLDIPHIKFKTDNRFELQNRYLFNP